ncbi:MAG: superoxide dismutase [Saprospiraceae bacterium]|nr:superoxide dismutase [Saprospiraceae bacterium]
MKLKNVRGLMSILVIFLSGFVLSAQPYSIPKLNYSYEALEPYIDAQTMEIHLTKHHQAYVTNLNKAVVGTKAEKIPLEELLVAAERRGPAIRNNGGGHYNHSLFWTILSPTADKIPKNKLAEEIKNTFVTVDSLKKLLNAGALSRFGSGWVWLYVTPDKKLAVSSTPNQDNPIMDAAKEQRGIPILAIDVWEHAYYLKYQNKRGDYLGAIWNVIDWNAIADNYEKALKSPLLKLIEKDSWQALKDFHSVMAETFHPVEEGNFKPIRERSGEMSAKAQLLASSRIPTSFKTPEISKAIKELVDGSAKLDKLVKKNSKDAKIKESITKLHDKFHVIQGLCSDEH